MAPFLTSLRTIQRVIGKRKPVLDRFGGADFSRKLRKFVQKIRVFDRRCSPPTYLEKVTDPDTGEVIHYCAEPLAKHRDHGSARKR